MGKDRRSMINNNIYKGIIAMRKESNKSEAMTINVIVATRPGEKTTF